MSEKEKQTFIVIMGAAGRDFHNFNMVYRDDPASRVIAFTANQIPEIAGRRYPPSLAGRHYPEGIPIVDESELAHLCRSKGIDEVLFAYSDVRHTEVMHKASIVLAAGADFLLLGPKRTMLRSNLPVISVSAVRTGCGKSQTTRWLSKMLKGHGLHVAVIRHPMPYGDLEGEAVQCFRSLADLDAAGCTIEEREEYEPHLAAGNVVYAGIDYSRILSLAEAEADLILWDGGNNDFPFIVPDLNIVLVDPMRPGHETTHHPGEAVLRMADIVVVAKVNSAPEADIERVIENVRKINHAARIVRAASTLKLDDPSAVRGKDVLVVEDGPTITHGGMPYGAGFVAACEAKAANIIDPRGAATGDIIDIFKRYPHIGPVLPAVGYSHFQLQELKDSINNAVADVVVAATPCYLGSLIEINKPLVRVSYEFAEAGEPGLGSMVEAFLKERKLVQ
ncbi:MAG: cyclic 2,3-diphosphoglycerate synthase [bacterium]|nr:cyclic 2,3-diphosphoglycerate synthase [bacterium]